LLLAAAQVAIGVPVVFLIVAGAYILWQKKPWKKDNKP
jgi:hypothetical protein